ncbi:helix-turn-helix domain-containing protein [Runella slithyformis]|uniref:Transcriptional regulator, AraC family n=1 Tax=Runella slithyformis (strain ATCC 29530 / DSM 19594 / LMG 11500 / NCIMB 11436 / LSU 4) TaxID=761193 RepID=A0A7U3ZL55_RUNSL|nr:helix-turn-helix domain-containing protein [Runella slithyformis]AEI49180.1 transcriptional regulator, AraC family [Runella slithyformis DSM 19594]
MHRLEKEIFEKLTHLIQQNLTNPAFSLSTICRELGISRTQLHRIVTAQSQRSITLYIRKVRMLKAKELLVNTDLRVSEITYEVGIDSPQNFSKYFTQEFNVSPTEFRKQNQTAESPAGTNPQVSIAVLPFVNMSSDPEQEYFCDGMTEEIINRLAQVSGLKIAGRTSSFTFKGQNMDVRQIGQRLNVDFVLEGSIRKSGHTLRITVQLNNTADGYQVWSERYDREAEEVFDIQDDISLSILNRIKSNLLSHEKDAVLKRYTNNSEAYRLYLHGRFYDNKFAGAENFHKAIDYYRAAIAIEPRYAIAYSGMASCYLNLWFYRYAPAGQCLPQLRQSAQRALELDDQIAESHLAVARLKMYYEWDLTGALNSFRKALELNHNMAEAHGQYALCLSILEDVPQALTHALTAFDLDPFSLINNFYTGYIYWIAGDFQKALMQGKRLLDLEPNFWGGHIIMGFNLIKAKRYDEALAELENALRQNYSGLTLSGYGSLLAMMGHREKAREVLRQMEILNQTQPVANYDMGIVYACLGDKDTACDFFEEAIALREPPMLFFRFIMRDWLAPFKNDPRYSALPDKVLLKGL